MAKTTTPAAKPIKKGATIAWTVGSRNGAVQRSGTVVAFIPKGEEPKAPKAAGTLPVSNRDRYLVKSGESYLLASARGAKLV